MESKGSDIRADSTASQAEIDDLHRQGGDPRKSKPRIDRSGQALPRRDGAHGLPPEARGDDYVEPPSLHDSSRRWIVISVIVVVALGLLAVGLLSGEQGTPGDEDAPLEGFRPQLSYEETVGEYAGSPAPGYSVLAVVENIGEDAGSLDDWSVCVKLEVNGDPAEEDREYLTGSLGSKQTRGVPFDLDVVELETGDEIKLTVILNTPGG